MSETGFRLPTSSTIGNEFVGALLNNPAFVKGLQDKGYLAKADTISQSTNLLWYDLRPVVQMLYPYRELIPRISRLPRVSADGGNAYHWKRIVQINTGNLTSGVSEGNRGARIGILEQDMVAAYKTFGYESSVTFEARLGARNLSPEALGISVQSALRSLMINEEQTLIDGNASLPLGTTPTPTLTQGAVTGLTGTFSGATVYVRVVALTGQGYYNSITPYNSTSGTGGVQGQITKINADGSSDTYGGGSANPSAEASLAVTGTNVLTGQVAAANGAFAYAWYVGSATGAEYLAGITPSNQALFTKFPSASTAQPITALKVGANYQDNSINQLLPDGVLTQIAGAILGPDPGRGMATAATLPTGVSASSGGSLIYTMPAGNTSWTLSGSNFVELDRLLQAAYEQYKLGYDRILMSAADINSTFGAMLAQASTANGFRIWFDADAETGRIVAGRRVTSYLNKWFNNTLDVEVHPWVPQGTAILWSDRSPYELSGVANILEARVRQDYYQIQWPWRTRRYEYGVYADEVFAMYYSPAFAILTNMNPSSGTLSF